MRSRARVLITLAALAAVGALATWLAFPGLLSNASHSSSPNVTAPLFAAEFPDEKGRIQALSQWRGQVVVLNFWATWCPPCREEMPELSAFQDQYRSRGLAVLGLSTDDVAKIRQFAHDAPVSYPLYSGEFSAMNLAEALGNNKGILPYTVVIGRDGHVAAAYFGRLNMSKLEQQVQPLLKNR